MTRRVKLPDAREAEIQRAILATLKHLGVPCWRQNVGAFAVGTGASRRYFRAGEVGQSDLMGVLPGSGRLICVEVKRPGNRPTPHQIAFIQRINDVGGFAFWAEDVTTVNVVVKAVLDNPRLRVEVAEDGTMVLTDEEEERS